MSQKHIFLAGEGDSWYERNLSSVTINESLPSFEDIHYICNVMFPFRDCFQKVLEIGCSSGLKLETICKHLGATGEGIDPSEMAIKNGMARSKTVDINIQVGSGESLPYENETFDLVYFGFCLYLFDRENLIQSFAEADRVLKPGGFMAITDFDPGNRYKKKYNHTDGVYSYKQDYTALLLNSGLYYLTGKHCYSHRKSFFDVDFDERISTSILYKEKTPYPKNGL